MAKKCIIITSINSYENTFIKNFDAFDYDIIVVGDLKTDHSTYLDKNNIIYIHPYTNDEQLQLFSNIIPFNHYSRKNVGYLYAIKHNYDVIFDTDDDNLPLDNFINWDKLENTKIITEPKMPNIYSLFTKKHIWPRGFPLELINKYEEIKFNDYVMPLNSNIGIYQSIAVGDPDVDAIFRLTNENYNKEIYFDTNKSFVLNKNIYTQGNTQITFWTCKELFHLLYIPCTTSFRFCDILKMYIAQKCMWEYDKLLCYISPIVKQIRNDHNLMTDFESEYPMYISVFKIINNIFENIKLNGNTNDIMIVYKELLIHNIVKDKEIVVLEKWLNEIQKNTLNDVNISSEDFLNKLQNNEHFSFVRYNDGEIISLMEYDFILNIPITNNTSSKNCDSHHYFKEMNKGLQEAVTSEENILYSQQHKYIFQINLDNIIYVIENQRDYIHEGDIILPYVNANNLNTLITLNKLNKLKEFIKVKRNKHEDHGELINIDIYNRPNNIVKFIDILNTKNIIVIGPEYLTKLRLFNVQKYIFTPMHNCFLEKDRIIHEIENTMNEYENNNESCIFLFSASMTTNYIIDKLFKKSLDKHTMIDVGSLWDNFMSKKINPVVRRIYNPEFIKNNYPENYWHEE